jgi:hypothetical protein
MGLFNLFKPAKTVLVIDAISLNESMGMKGKVPPRNQLQMLRRLARFSQREKIEVIAVLTGSPLNKAPAGKKFEGIVVLYSKDMDKHAKFMAKIVAGKGPGAVLVSGNAAVEKVAGSSVKKMRISTFRKAFDVGGENEGMDRGDSNRGRNNRQSRRRPAKQSNNNNNSNEPKKERPPKDVSEADAINELIDLVD